VCTRQERAPIAKRSVHAPYFIPRRRMFWCVYGKTLVLQSITASKGTPKFQTKKMNMARKAQIATTARPGNACTTTKKAITGLERCHHDHLASDNSTRRNGSTGILQAADDRTEEEAFTHKNPTERLVPMNVEAEPHLREYVRVTNLDPFHVIRSGHPCGSIGHGTCLPVSIAQCGIHHPSETFLGNVTWR